MLLFFVLFLLMSLVFPRWTSSWVSGWSLTTPLTENLNSSFNRHFSPVEWTVRQQLSVKIPVKALWKLLITGLCLGTGRQSHVGCDSDTCRWTVLSHVLFTSCVPVIYTMGRIMWCYRNRAWRGRGRRLSGTRSLLWTEDKLRVRPSTWAWINNCLQKQQRTSFSHRV